MTIKTTTTKYEIDLEEIKTMLIRELNLVNKNVTVKYNLATKFHTGGYVDPRDDNSYQEVSNITVEVKS